MESWRDQIAVRLCEKRRFTLSKYEIMGQISSLPEHIIHLILDHLPLKDAARMSILSKNWKNFLSYYPILNLHLDHNLFGLQFLLAAESEQEPNIHEIRERFMDFVDDHLSEVIWRSVRKLALNVAVNDSKCFPRVDRLMELVTKLKRVEELSLFVQTNDSKWDDDIEVGNVFYSVPFSVLASSKGLLSLHIRGCNFGSLSQDNFGSTVVGACSSLRRLSLLHAVFDEQVVVNLTRYCPGIEVLEFDNCNFWVESLVLSVFPRLKKASFLDNRGSLEMITIDSVSLESFKSNSIVSSKFIPSACGSIKELSLGCQAPANFCVELDMFPLLEEADLIFGSFYEEAFKAANHHLRKLSCSFDYYECQAKEVCVECPNLEWFKFVGKGSKEFYIDCPNLAQFWYSGDVFPKVKTTSVVKDIYFDAGVIMNFTIPWFIQLRGVIGQMAQVGRVIHLHFICRVNMVESMPSEAFQASPQIVHVELFMPPHVNLTNPAALVDGLILSTRPTTLTVRGRGCRDFLKDLCEKLATKPRRKACEEFCNKCWWHHLEDFEIENSEATIKKNLIGYEIENSIGTGTGTGTEDIKKNLADFVEMVRPDLMTSCFKFFWRSSQIRDTPLE